MLNKFKYENNEFIADGNGSIFYYWDINENEKKEIEQKIEIDIHSINSSLDLEEVSRLETMDHEDNFDMESSNSFNSCRPINF